MRAFGRGAGKGEARPTFPWERRSRFPCSPLQAPPPHAKWPKLSEAAAAAARRTPAGQRANQPRRLLSLDSLAKCQGDLWRAETPTPPPIPAEGRWFPRLALRDSGVGVRVEQSIGSLPHLCRDEGSEGSTLSCHWSVLPIFFFFFSLL